MRKSFLSLIILLLVVCKHALIAQNNDWQPLSGGGNSDPYCFLIKQDGNVTYVIDSMLNATKREYFVTSTKKYIAKNLEILHEPEFNEPVWIMLIPDRNEMYKCFGKKQLSMTLKDGVPNGYAIAYVHDVNHSWLNRELMSLMAIAKWGEIKDQQLFWLKEGLATYANPEAYSCDGHNFEERYVWFVQSEKLTNLLKFPKEEDRLQYKIARNQSAYIVEYLLENYGVDRVKQLWQEQMTDFEKIVGITFEDLAINIDNGLNKKYVTSITFNQDDFNKDCINPQPDDWFPAYNPPGYYLPVMDRMVTKEIGNLKFTLDSILSLPERDYVIARSKELIAQHLELINELPFNDSIHLVLVPTRNDMNNLLGGPIGGFTYLKDEGPKDGGYPRENTIYAVHGGIHNALGHEIMHMVVDLKWGARYLLWLNEGLASLSSPESFGCDGYTFEERYVYFLQNEKLLAPNASIEFETKDDCSVSRKILYSQSAYIVGCLLDNYGVEKLKQLWQSNINDFEKIYGISFENYMLRINNELNNKFPAPIEFNWERFCEDCIK